MPDIEEKAVFDLANSSAESSSIEGVVEIFAGVMNMICEFSREDTEKGTDYRNAHPAAKVVAARLRNLVMGPGRPYDSYAKLFYRSGAEDAAFGRLYTKYDGAMDACNLSGIIFSFDRDMAQIKEAATRANERLSENPIVVCVVDKICQLTKS